MVQNSASPSHLAPTIAPLKAPYPPTTGIMHELKCWPESYEPVLGGLKRAELRIDDRPEGPYRAGDLLLLREWVREPPIWPEHPNSGERFRWTAENRHCFESTYIIAKRGYTDEDVAYWRTDSAPCFADPSLHNPGRPGDPEQADAHSAASAAWLSHVARTNGTYTGRSLYVGVAHVVRAAFNVPAGYALLSLTDVISCREAAA